MQPSFIEKKAVVLYSIWNIAREIQSDMRGVSLSSISSVDFNQAVCFHHDLLLLDMNLADDTIFW